MEIPVRATTQTRGSVVRVCSGFQWITAHYPQLLFRLKQEVDRKPDTVVCYSYFAEALSKDIILINTLERVF